MGLPVSWVPLRHRRPRTGRSGGTGSTVDSLDQTPWLRRSSGSRSGSRHRDRRHRDTFAIGTVAAAPMAQTAQTPLPTQRPTLVPNREAIRDPGVAAFYLLRAGFVAAPILFGIDKFFDRRGRPQPAGLEVRPASSHPGGQSHPSLASRRLVTKGYQMA